MNPEYLAPLRPRVLRNLSVREVSLVDKGAGRGVDVKLLKREEPTMPLVEVRKRCDALWHTYVSFIAERDKCTNHEAINKALATEMGRELFQTARDANLQFQLQKMGSAGGLAQNPPNMMGAVGGREAAATSHDGSGQRALSDHSPKDAVSGEANLARLRREHATKALRAFNQHVDGMVKNGMSRSQAMDRASQQHPELWAQAKEASGIDGPGASGESVDAGGRVISETLNSPHSAPVSPGYRGAMRPHSHDGNAPRPPRYM
jgi:hypothetical protein